MALSALFGDITKLEVDAVCNPANSYGLMGGGVAYAIRETGGQVIEDEAVSQAPIHVGAAVATTGGRLAAKYVIHAPTMAEPAIRIGLENVRLAVRAALESAKSLGISSLAFPGMGTGVGGLNFEDSAKAMVEEIASFNPPFDVYLVGFTESHFKIFSGLV